MFFPFKNSSINHKIITFAFRMMAKHPLERIQCTSLPGFYPRRINGKVCLVTGVSRQT